MKQDGPYFTKHVEKMTDFCLSASVANVVVLESFNMETEDQLLHSIIDDHNLILISNKHSFL